MPDLLQNVSTDDQLILFDDLKYLLYADHYQKNQPFLAGENDPRFSQVRDPCFRPSESAKESFFAKPLYAFLFASFGLKGQAFAFEYLTVKEKYSVEDSSRIIERIASLSSEATARI